MEANITIKDNSFNLFADKSIFWVEAKTLILADIHLGKAPHFRKHGIAVPDEIGQEDLRRLQQLMFKTHPERVLILGDFFHSSMNNEAHYFKLWRQQFTSIEFILIKGNHDILESGFYTDIGLTIHQNYLKEQSFVFIHNLNEIHRSKNSINDSSYVFSGHIHPGIRLTGKAKQSMKLPCYVFGEHHSILPAFSTFSGLAMLRPNKKDQIYVIAANKVIKLDR